MGWFSSDKTKKEKEKELESLSPENLRALKAKMKEGKAGDVGATANISAIKKRNQALADAANF